MTKHVIILTNSNTLYPKTYNNNNNNFNNSIINNNGNMVFMHAVINLITNDKKYYNDISLDEVNDAECLVVPAANWISSSLDLTSLVNYLKNIQIPIVILGLGAQADTYDNMPTQLHHSALDLIELMKNKECVVGSRGPISQQILANHGIDSTIIGCSSNLINTDENFTEKLVNKWNKPSQFCVGIGNDINTKDEIKILAERMIFEFGTKYGFYLQQSYMTAINALRHNNIYAESYISQELYRKIGINCKTYDEFTSLLIKNSRIYISIDQWMEDVARMDLCFGTRIHGNILAMQSQCPSVVIYHDARTKELAETMEYPRISVENFTKIRSIDELKDKCVVNFDLYTTKRLKLKQNLKNILSKYNVSII